jgi:kojibiose phosphorylase
VVAPDKAAELTEWLALNPGVVDHWRHIINQLTIDRAPEGKAFEQFEGYFARRGVDLDALELRTCSVQALLGLKATNETQVLKQPDVLMLFYMLPDEFSEAALWANWDYYTPPHSSQRTDNGCVSSCFTAASSTSSSSTSDHHHEAHIPLR